jgi:hypothetical protein
MRKGKEAVAEMEKITGKEKKERKEAHLLQSIT